MRNSAIERRAILATTAAVLSAVTTRIATAQQVQETSILGKWAADDSSVKLDMFKNGSEFQARLLYGNQIMEADNATFKPDTRNPDPALRTRSLQNIVFIRGLRWENGEWTGGSLYDASSGQTYRCRAEIRGEKMLLRGYVGISAFGQTREFHRF